MKNIRNVLFWIFLSLTIAIDVLIIVESCIGGSGSAKQSIGVTQAIVDFVTMIDPSNSLKDNPDKVHAVVRKIIGHFLLFGLSGLTTTLTFVFAKDILHNKKKIIIPVIFGIGLALASLTELIQYFVPGRAGMLTDILIDFAGYSLFAFTCLLITSIVVHGHRMNAQ